VCFLHVEGIRVNLILQRIRGKGLILLLICAPQHVCLCWGLAELGSNIQWERCCSFGKYRSLREVHDSTWTLLRASSGPSSSL